MKCYRFVNSRGDMGSIYTPAHSNYEYNKVVKFSKNTGIYKPIKLKPYTTLNKIRLIPAILAAKLARLVRKTRNKKCTELENKLMRFYYIQEVRVRGYVG